MTTCVQPDGRFDEEAFKEMKVVTQNEADEDEQPKEKKSKKKKRKD
jgi:hypothetical protein